MSNEASSSRRSPSSTPVNRPIDLPDTSQVSLGGSTLRVSSPLGPASTPKPVPTPLPPTEDFTSLTPPASSHVPRETHSPPEEPLRPLTMSLTSAHGQPSSIALPDIEDGKKKTTGSRSKSPVRLLDVRDQIGPLLDADDPKMSSSWWGEKHVARPWHDVPKRKKTIPPEQAVALEDTRKRVAQAVIAALGTTADVVHEALYIGVELLEFVPIPGLRAAAHTLLNIWDAAQNVDMNRLACLRLTERCADILLSVREEVHEAGDEVGEELQAPLVKLELCFTNVYRFMIKQKTRPWLKRYLKRDEILRDIFACDNELRDALALFGISIQIRILKQVQKTEKRREHETHILSALLASRLFPDNLEGSMMAGHEIEHVYTHTAEPTPYIASTEYSSEVVTQIAATKNALGIVDDHPVLNKAEYPKILPDLETIHTLQNSLDAASDMDDLRQLMREALQTNSDAEMLKVLQIGRQEMPDAIKTLQRSLERLSDRPDLDLSSQPSSAQSVVLGKVTRRTSVKETSGTDRVQRSETIISFDDSDSNTSLNASGSSDSKSRARDTLDREFMETGIDTLRRMSRGVEISVPTWTITKYEVDRGEMIGVGFFSAVYKGVWRERVVAIKVLAEATPRKLFLREIGIWKTLRHPNVLPLYGASSASGDPPWFFVTQYQKNGTLSEYLRRVAADQKPPGLGLEFNVISGASAFLTNSPGRVGAHAMSARSTSLPSSAWMGTLSSNQPSLGESLTPPNARTPRSLPHNNNETSRQWDLFRFMHEIAKGMEYLHGKQVLHGDLKASNVLVDDKYRCVISDFGQSEMKSEAFRISGTFPPHATLGWQSPEFMSGQSRLSTAVDVWAFSITCAEIMNMGRMPWSPMDDNSVRHFVLVENTRPGIPRYSRFNVPGFQAIIRSCWPTEPEKRASFSKIAKDFKLLRKSYAKEGFESPSPRIPPIEELLEPSDLSHSPDMRPLEPELPVFLRGGTGEMPPDDIFAHGELKSNGPYSSGLEMESSDHPHQERTVATAGMKTRETVIYTPGQSSRSSTHSVRVAPTLTDGQLRHFGHADSGYDSPPPIDERKAQARNELGYKVALIHEYHPSLTLPLWEPSDVDLGAVGYLLKPEGRFVTLFNSYAPHKSDNPGIRSLPSIHGYGVVKDDIQRLPKKTVTQRALDIFIGSLTFRNSSEDVSRRPTFPLKAGHKAAVLYAETTEYRYMVTLDAARKWFHQNVDSIMRIYGHQHHIQKEDLFLIIGTLKTPNYALLVSHHHPEGHARFNVYANPKTGKPWGTFTTDTDVPLGPSYVEDSDDEIPRLSASKVSLSGAPWQAVLLARLRFKPDATEPTSR